MSGSSRAPATIPTTRPCWSPPGAGRGNASGRVSSGLHATGGAGNRPVQIWTGKAWTAAGPAFADVPLYPPEHLLPDGKVFASGPHRASQLYDPAAHTST